MNRVMQDAGSAVRKVKESAEYHVQQTANEIQPGNASAYEGTLVGIDTLISSNAMQKWADFQAQKVAVYNQDAEKHLEGTLSPERAALGQKNLEDAVNSANEFSETTVEEIKQYDEAAINKDAEVRAYLGTAADFDLGFNGGVSS